MRKQIAAQHFARVSALFLVATTLLSISPSTRLAAGNVVNAGMPASAQLRETAKVDQTNPREKDMTAASQSIARTLETNPREKDMTSVGHSFA